ncbi:MAG: hypothetical protein HY231_01060 [Acidobacteria bacterium]|nr:hypothetical protein [Acidobacteriota bacterium]
MPQRTVKLVVFAAALILCVYLLRVSTAAKSGVASAPQKRLRSQKNPPAKTPAQPAYAKFNHNVPQHLAQNCDACHKFPTANWKEIHQGKDAYEDITDYPSHPSCLNCHRQQFFKGAQPTICTICHTNPGPRHSSRHPFPNPRELFEPSPKGQSAVSQYEVFFPHDKHEGFFGQMMTRRSATLRYAAFQQSAQPAAPAAPTGCATCHQLYQAQGEAADEYVTPAPKDLKDEDFWLKKGTFMGAPTSHATCFACHTQGGGLKPEPSDCARCHKLSPLDKLTEAQSDFDAKLAANMAIKDKTMLEKWRRRQAGKFRHEWFSHAELKCSDCHKIAEINTASGKGAVVNVLSCGGSGGCHITPTSDEGGALNFEIDQRQAKATFQCTKCHVNEGKKPLPESHSKALAAITKK